MDSLDGVSLLSIAERGAFAQGGPYTSGSLIDDSNASLSGSLFDMSSVGDGSLDDFLAPVEKKAKNQHSRLLRDLDKDRPRASVLQRMKQERAREKAYRKQNLQHCSYAATPTVANVEVPHAHATGGLNLDGGSLYSVPLSLRSAARDGMAASVKNSQTLRMSRSSSYADTSILSTPSNRGRSGTMGSQSSGYSTGSTGGLPTSPVKSPIKFRLASTAKSSISNSTVGR